MTYIDIFQNHFKAVFPELFMLTAIIILLLYAVLYNPSAKHKYPIMTMPVLWLSVQSLILTIGLILNSASLFPRSSVLFNSVLIVDDLTILIKTIILLSALSSILIASSYILKQRLNSFEYIILILFSTLGMLLIVSSYDLISMYLAIELQSLSFYVIAAFQRNSFEKNEFSTEAGLKYFVLGALSSGLLLFGESILYGFTGITNFEELTKLFTIVNKDIENLAYIGETYNILSVENVLVSNPQVEFFGHDTAVFIGSFFILVAFLFKIGAVPFHMWTPDVYEGAPTSVTAFFAITPKIAILSLLLRLCLYTFYDLIESWQEMIIVCSLLSMFIGTFGALNQKKIKRLFAYSSIAHVGYLLIGLATGTIEAVESLLIYIIIYILMIINVFGILLVLSKHDEGAFNCLNVQPVQRWYKYDRGFFPTLSEAEMVSDKILPTENSRHADINVRISGQQDEVSLTSTKRYFFRSLSGQNLCPMYLKASNPLWDVSATDFDYISTQIPTLRQGLHNVGTSVQGIPEGVSTRRVSSPRLDTAPFSQSHTNFTGIKAPVTSGRGLTPTTPLATTALRKIGKKQVFVAYITDLSSLSKTNPILCTTAAILFFSNAGIPPLAGFYGKLNVFLAAVEASMYFVALAGVVCNVIGAFYSIRLVKILYFHAKNLQKPHQQQLTWYQSISKENAIILAITFFFTIFFFFYPSFLFTLTHTAALSLCI